MDNEECVVTIVPDSDMTEICEKDFSSANIYASFDLSHYTDMVNTMFVIGAFDDREKKIILTFSSLSDYPLFAKLSREMANRKWYDRFFRKNSKSIFMHISVTTETGYEKWYKYEFTNCSLFGLSDTEYLPMPETVLSPVPEHTWSVVFKYKKLKIE